MLKSLVCGGRKVFLIYHDVGRSNGYWYALVPVCVSGKSERAMEVTLNGGGRSKAKEKIERMFSYMVYQSKHKRPFFLSAKAKLLRNK